MITALLLAVASAAPPVHYTAMLTDTSGTPIQGDVTVDVSLFTAPDDTSPAWTRRYALTLDNGHLDLALTGLDPADLQANSELQLAVDELDLSRRAALHTVPRAERAALVRRVRPGAVSDACTAATEGTLRRLDGELQGCTPTGWRTLSR